jgi:hypothetical protein
MVEEVIEIVRVLDREMEDGVQTRVKTPQGHEVGKCYCNVGCNELS